MEHRCSYRSRCRVPVRLHGGAVDEILGCTRDIGMGGMFVETGGPMIPLNTVMEVSFPGREGDDGDLPVRAKMIVVHQQRGVGMGFMFCSLEEGVRRFLGDLLGQASPVKGAPLDDVAA